MDQLTPSQAIKKKPPDKSGGQNSNNNQSENGGNANNNKQANNNGNSNNKGRNNRNRRRRNGNKNANPNDGKPVPDNNNNNNNINKNNNNTGGNAESEGGNNNQTNKGKNQRQRQRQRQRGNKKPNESGENSNNDKNATDNNNNGNKQQPKRKPEKKRPPKKKYPWRKDIPKGAVDPITLEDLDSLEYPPFALCADEPYVPVPVWPVPPEKEENKDDSVDASAASAENLEDLNRQRLADQWGEFMLPDKPKSSKADNKPKVPAVPLSKRPLNLFDGRALAFYMVSQLQFIDPFTRRDLTRAELQNLDRYLDRHGGAGIDEGNNKQRNKNKKKQQKLKVTDAYDAKGITLSSAGAAAATAQGRADIMQQTAQQLLNSLFVGQPSVSADPTPQPTSLQEQYAAMQRQERANARAGERRFEEQQQQQQVEFLQSADQGNGFMIIDDDENPELRGRGHSDFPTLAAAAPAPSPMYSASHIAGRYGNQPASANQAGSFPALPSAGPKPSSTVSTSAPTQTKPKKSKTLSKISGIVKKTTAQEKQKQWEAREAARRKAMLSNLTYGMNPVAMDPSQSLLVAPTAASSNTASEEQLQRNRAFADALGVKPAAQRHYASGWARPTDGEHINDLEVALYPDELIMSARDHSMDVLIKLERRWKRFLGDDKAASLPLNKMNRSLRKMVHHYAEFWHLKTESFDPEPNRYIHCVKLPDTRMPQPLLSDVVRNWRGPSLPDATRTIASVMNDHTLQQTAGQTSKSSYEPAPLKLRSATAMSSSKGDLVAFGEAQTNSRSESLMDKQRPQLKLLPRTVPLELPPMEDQQDANFDIEEDMRRRQVRLEEKRRKEREIEQKKKQALQDIFDSDDEESVGNKVAGFSDSDSEWDDNQEALFDGSDEE